MNDAYRDRQERWAQALESGEYIHGHQVLHRQRIRCSEKIDGVWGHEIEYEDMYCALGVACEVYVRETGDNSIRKKVDRRGGSIEYRYGGSDARLPRKIREWYGLKSQYGGSGKGTPTIATLNDYRGSSFAEIAQHIRENFKRLSKPA